jgi:hypothetical protein
MSGAAWLVLCFGVLAGCAGDEALRATLDEKGRTWVGPDMMLTFARAAPRFSVAARDYLYIAPVETNEMGARRQYLWLGLGTTVDRAWRSAAPSTAAKVVLTLDGQPMALSLAAWEGTAGAPAIETPAPVYQVQRASVSLDQLERLANAASIDVQIVTDGGAAEAYELWDGAWSDWQAFVTHGAPGQERERVARAARAAR